VSIEENKPKHAVYEFGDFRLDAGKRLLTKDLGVAVPLMPKAFDTLVYLVKNCGKLIDKDELLREVWPDTIVEENNLTQNISILRRALGEKHRDNRFIATVPGRGYKFVADVRETDSVIKEENPDLSGLNGDPNDPISAQSIDRINEVSLSRPFGTEISSSRSMVVSALVAVLIGVASLGTIAYFIWPQTKPDVRAAVTSVAVLPFRPIVAENRDEALELGMADALIAKLSGGNSLLVRPLSSVRKFNSVDQDPVTAGKELGVDSVLDGTIQTWGDRLRVSAKLIRTSDGKQLWSGQFDDKFNDIFALQDSISAKVASALEISLRRDSSKPATDSIQAYQLYMNGRYHLSKLTAAEIRASIPYFEKAIETDQTYAAAYTGISNAYRVLGISGEMQPSEVIAKSRAAETKAISLDGNLVEAHISRCMTLFWFEWQWKAAEDECRLARTLDPGNASAHSSYAHLLSNLGRHDEALSEAKRALELDPLDLAENALLGQFLLHAGRPDEALSQLNKASELEPNFWMPHFFASTVYIEKGMFAEAIRESDEERRLTGVNDIPFGAYALAKSGHTAEAESQLNELLGLAKTRFVPPYNIAMIYNALGMTDESLTWLERGFSEHDPKMTFLNVEPKWNNLRHDPRFVDIITRMNF